MDANALPIDAQAMLRGLRPWVECESPTFDATAVGRMMALAAPELVALGATVEWIEGRMGFGPSVRAVLPHTRQGEPGVLVLGHMDTVHPVGTLAALPWRVEGDRAWGPGIYDMKGGNYLVLEALRQLSAAGVATGLPVVILFTPDEEVGTPSTRQLIEAEAARSRFVLVPEPARPGNGVVTGRYAIARFDLEAVGVPSHAGARLAEGRSAIAEMARQIPVIEAMTTEDCTFSVGVVQGGQWVNCVATTCRGEALSMAKRQADLDRGVAAMLALGARGSGTQFRVRRGVTRPVWEPDDGGMALYTHAVEQAARLGQSLPHGSAGGGSDGNFTGAAGVPTLDGLGVAGAGGHTLDEHLVISSLVERTRLMAALLATLR